MKDGENPLALGGVDGLRSRHNTVPKCGCRKSHERKLSMEHVLSQEHAATLTFQTPKIARFTVKAPKLHQANKAAN
jgi:hypothetical protein